MGVTLSWEETLKGAPGGPPPSGDPGGLAQGDPTLGVSRGPGRGVGSLSEIQNKTNGTLKNVTQCTSLKSAPHCISIYLKMKVYLNLPQSTSKQGRHWSMLAKRGHCTPKTKCTPMYQCTLNLSRLTRPWSKSMVRNN